MARLPNPEKQDKQIMRAYRELPAHQRRYLKKLKSAPISIAKSLAQCVYRTRYNLAEGNYYKLLKMFYDIQNCFDKNKPVEEMLLTLAIEHDEYVENMEIAENVLTYCREVRLHPSFEVVDDYFGPRHDELDKFSTALPKDAIKQILADKHLYTTLYDFLHKDDVLNYTNDMTSALARSVTIRQDTAKAFYRYIKENTENI